MKTPGADSPPGYGSDGSCDWDEGRVNSGVWLEGPWLVIIWVGPEPENHLGRVESAFCSAPCPACCTQEPSVSRTEKVAAFLGRCQDVPSKIMGWGER